MTTSSLKERLAALGVEVPDLATSLIRDEYLARQASETAPCDEHPLSQIIAADFLALRKHYAALVDVLYALAAKVEEAQVKTAVFASIEVAEAELRVVRAARAIRAEGFDIRTDRELHESLEALDRLNSATPPADAQECPECKGVGQVEIGEGEEYVPETCDECNGTGSVPGSARA